MQTKNWSVPHRIEKSYARAIARLIKGLLPDWAGGPFAFVAALRRLVRSPTFMRAAEAIARSMATNVFSDGWRTWRQAAAEGSKGREIYNALQSELQSSQVGRVYQEIVSRNAELIRSLPERLADRATQIASDGFAQGLRPEAVTAELMKSIPGMTLNQAKLIARTETSKASTALTEARCRSADINWYVWRTSQDARVRSSHDHMEGVLVSWEDPPSPERLIGEKFAGYYHAGNIYNCRCYPEALIRFDQVAWPARVYANGSIRSMTLAKFKAMIGGEL